MCSSLLENLDGDFRASRGACLTTDTIFTHISCRVKSLYVEMVSEFYTLFRTDSDTETAAFAQIFVYLNLWHYYTPSVFLVDRLPKVE